MNAGPQIMLDWKHTFRVIPSQFPPVNFFETLVDPDLMEEVFYIESLTNDRLRDEIGDISLVPREDRISGIGSTIVMAAFTHISTARSSRFTDGTFGIYYAAKELETAIKEKAYHSEKFLSYTNEAPGSLTMRVYQSKKLLQPLIDIRGSTHSHLHDPVNYSASQVFGLQMKEAREWGLVYKSVRHSGGECVAILRPPAIPLPVIQTQHLTFDWNGTKIYQYYEIGKSTVSI
ncbi:MAG: RES family NAD+ phosphorylase [Candidatus Berkiella sp.]